MRRIETRFNNVCIITDPDSVAVFHGTGSNCFCFAPFPGNTDTECAVTVKVSGVTVPKPQFNRKVIIIYQRSQAEHTAFSLQLHKKAWL